jgi:thioredoxin 2
MTHMAHEPRYNSPEPSRRAVTSMSATSDYFVRCGHCYAKNKVPLARLGQNPVCGKCKRNLFSPSSALSSGSLIVACRQCQSQNRVRLEKIASQPRCGKCRAPLALEIRTGDAPAGLTDQSFSETVLLSSLPTLVNFYSPNCGPCRLLNPVVRQIARDYEGRLQVASLNVEANQYIPSLYRVGGTPTLVLFQRGKEVARLEGYQPAARIREWVGPYLW